MEEVFFVDEEDDASQRVKRRGRLENDLREDYCLWEGNMELANQKYFKNLEP